MLLDLFRHAGISAWPLGLCSILAGGVILERLYTLSRLRTLEERAFMMLQLGFEKNDDAMIADQKIAPAPVATVMSHLVKLRGANEDAILQASDLALAMQRLRLRRYLGTLATIGATAPFIGLFGTVLGVMSAFQEMAQKGLGGEQMSAGISEALSATALGLLVAIPSVIMYNYLTGRVSGLMLTIQGHVARLTGMLKTLETQEV